MNQSRRDFLKCTAGMGAVALASGCATKPGCGFPGAEGSMTAYADKPFEKLRIGVVGLNRGANALHFNSIPGCEVTAVCDITPQRIKWRLGDIRQRRQPTPKVYGYRDGKAFPEDWKRLCEDPDVDLVYNGTPWELHVPIALYAMECGKHVVTEVPSAFTVEECWRLVETSERTRRHCMQLENCCYGENEMLCLNLVRLGLMGDLVHGEGAYIHDLREKNYAEFLSGGYWNYWRLRHNIEHAGNAYPTHGLGPIAMCMDINRGDRFDYVVSVDSKQFSFETFGKKKCKGTWLENQKVDMGNMNTSVIRTMLGRTIMMQHDISSPRPYSRINTLSGTKGILMDYPLRIALAGNDCAGTHKFDDKETQRIRDKFKHPLWKQAGEIAKTNGGHGGMDFMMLLRLAYCLQNGLPLDMNVYDLASWCCLCELTEISARNRGRSMDVPDFTRGGWKMAKPKLDLSIDLAKMNVSPKDNRPKS